MTSCTIDWSDEKDKKIIELSQKNILPQDKMSSQKNNNETSIFLSEYLGVWFEVWVGSGIFLIDTNWLVPSLKIYYAEKNENDKKYYSIYSGALYEVFYRWSHDEDPHILIKNLIREKWLNSDNCEITTYKDAFWYESYSIDLKEKNIQYSNSETVKLELAKIEHNKDGWPQYLWTQDEIYNQRRLNECGIYTQGSFRTSSGTITILFDTSLPKTSIEKYWSLKLFDPIR